MRYTPVQQLGNSATSSRRTSANPLKLVVVASCVGAVLLAGLYVLADRTSSRVVAHADGFVTVAPTVSLLSARRAPNTLSFVTRTGKVSRAVAAVTGLIPDNSCMTVDWMGQRMGSLHPEKTFVPASATKIVTAAAALEILGPTFTYSTNVYGTIDPTGSVNDLFLVGGGDPVLIRAEYPAMEKYGTINGTSLEKLADAIVAAGVKRIAGAVVGVDNRYDDKRYVDVWPKEFHSTEAGPLGALVVDDGLLMGSEMKPDDPAVSAASELRVLLEARGIGVGALSRHDPTAPSGDPIASVSSAPLTQIVQEMLVNSDNNTAELLLKEIGYSAKKVGTTEAGLTAIKEKLVEWKIAGSNELFDGSGLASGNRISCNTFVSLLSKFDTVIPNLLAIAGVSGTIRDSFTNEAVNANLRGKTGTLNGVKALVGYLPIENSDPVIFSLVMNRTGIDNQSAYRPIWYAFADALNRAKSTPRPEQLAP